MGKYSWFGPYEILKEDPKKFDKLCTIKVRANKKIAKIAPKPDKVVLWNFVSNLRDKIIPVGDHKPPLMGYDNLKYLNLFQELLQNLWKIFEPRFNEIIPIIPLSQANDAGLYDPNCLKEQFPGAGNGNAPGYKGGSFNQRQMGGWKWFSLIIDSEDWGKEWRIRHKPEKMSIKEEKIEKIAPMYYEPYIYVKGKWTKEKKRNALYGRPYGCKFIPRRYNIPIFVGARTSMANLQRYKTFVTTIRDDLNAQWTLNVWNILSFGYNVSKKSVLLEMKPEINIDLGWIGDPAQDKKAKHTIDDDLYQHFKEVYHISVGLPDKYKLKLPLYIKKKLNPLWNGYADGIDTILAEPYGQLLDLALEKLRDLIGRDVWDSIIIVEDSEASRESEEFVEFEELIESLDRNNQEDYESQDDSNPK